MKNKTKLKQKLKNNKPNLKEHKYTNEDKGKLKRKRLKTEKKKMYDICNFKVKEEANSENKK